MQCYRILFTPVSAFGTPLVGDTLFGQLCWAISHRFGQEYLQNLLVGYLEQKPFMVVSDAFPQGYIPLPHLPSKFWLHQVDIDQKVLKKKRWVDKSVLDKPLIEWQKYAVSEKEIIPEGINIFVEQPHNTINRQTGTTGDAPFSPYMVEQAWFPKKYNMATKFELYVLLDEQRFGQESLLQVLKDIGEFGYGKDASIGLGKFIVEEIIPHKWNEMNHANAYLTLANCAPQGLPFDNQNSYYQITTRFGRHGSLLGLKSSPFKKPLLLAKQASVFKPNTFSGVTFIGQGIGEVSYEQPNAVHQGYAPVIPIQLPLE